MAWNMAHFYWIDIGNGVAILEMTSYSLYIEQ